MPVKLRTGGIERIVAPALSGQEQTTLETALSIADRDP
jgi:hypothetical protein